MAKGERRRRASRRSVQWRLTFIATAIVGLIITVGVLALFQVMHSMALRDLEERGAMAVQRMAQDIERSGMAGAVRTQVPPFYLLQVVDAQGRVIAAGRDLEGRPPMDDLRPERSGQVAYRITEVPGQESPVFLAAQRLDAPDGVRYLLAAGPIQDMEKAAQTFGIFVSVMIPVVLVLVWWIVWASVGHALAPFALMRRELSQITGGAMNRRVTVPDTDDEVAELAKAINVTLDRLQKFVEAQRRFVADVSHELRSPLTALRTQLEVALVHPEDEDWPAVARAALDDADRLQKVVADVLTIAKLEAGIRAEREPVDLGALARAEATDRPRRVPVHVQVRDVARPLIINGSRTQLVRVLTNLLDNAERHAESEIRLNVYRDGDEAVLEVADDGEGIPPEDRERVFQRFQRLPEGRRRDTQGSGLGLAISRDIAVAHGGSLVADESEQGGALLILRLPLRDPAPSTPEPSRR